MGMALRMPYGSQKYTAHGPVVCHVIQAVTEGMVMENKLPKAGDVITLLDKPSWDDFTNGKEYTLLSDCVQDRWDWFKPDVKANVLDDKGMQRSINLNRFKWKG
jgi:hypothetical protein